MVVDLSRCSTSASEVVGVFQSFVRPVPFSSEIMDTKNINLTSYDEEIIKVSSVNGIGLVVGLLTTMSLLVFVTVVLFVFFALKRCYWDKSDKMTSAEHQIESAFPDLKQPPTEENQRQRSSVDRLLAQPTLIHLLEPVTQEIHPELRPTTSTNYYTYGLQQQQQQQQQLSLSGVVAKQGQNLLIRNEAERNSCNYQGRIWFSVTFDPMAEASQQQMNVHISKVELDVSPREVISLDRWQEGYVCVYLLPDESHQLRTTAVDRTGTSFAINQTLVFQFGPPRCLTEHLLPSALRLSVYQIDHRRLRHTLGHVILTLNDRCGLESEDVLVCEDLISDEALSNYNSLGEIRVSMTYDPEANRMTVAVIEARGFRQLDLHKESFVVVEQLLGDQVQKAQRISNRKRKTSHISSEEEEAACPSPLDHFTYKQAVHFTLPASHLDLSSFRVSVMNPADRLGHLGDLDIEYGRITLGPFMYARGDQLDHWAMVTKQPYETVTRWHGLTREERKSK